MVHGNYSSEDGTSQTGETDSSRFRRDDSQNRQAQTKRLHHVYGRRELPRSYRFLDLMKDLVFNGDMRDYFAHIEEGAQSAGDPRVKRILDEDKERARIRFRFELKAESA